MWSFIELCDTLQLNEEQGFPTDILNYKKHFENPINIKEVENKIFDFKNKPAIRLYQAPPVRNFLVQNIDWKWLYWWHIDILEIKHNYIDKTTSWKYKITYINNLNEMKNAFHAINKIPKMNFLSLSE